MDLDICQCWWLTEKIRRDDVYAQNLYAAMCNQEWQYQDAWTILKDKTWSCSWRTAGQIIADIRGSGDYIDWHCSGMGFYIEAKEPESGFVPEGMVTEEIRADLAELGWHPMGDTDAA